MSAALRKCPPHSLEAEQSTLGGLLLDNRAWHELAGQLREEDFYLRRHRLVWRAIGELLRREQPCDFVTVAEHLRQRGELEEAGGLAGLGALAVDTPSAANVRAYAAIVRERAALRGLIAAGQDIAGLGWQPEGRAAELLLEAAQGRLAQVGRTRQQRARSFAEVIDLADQAIGAARRRREAGEDLGIPSGIPCLDRRTGGWHADSLVVIAARPSLGKTALLNQMAVHAARRGHAGLIFSLEMGPETLGIRAMATAAGVNLTALAGGLRGPHEAAARKAVELAALPLFVDTETYSLGGICAQAGEYRRVHGIRWAAVDHIGLVEHEGFHSRNEQVGAVTRTLKKLAKRLGIPVLALSQLNRGVERERRRPTLADLRDSGNIEQDADVCLFLHSDSEDNRAAIPVELGLLKNRGGRRGWLQEAVQFDGATQTFAEAAARGGAGPPPRQAAVPPWQDGADAA